MEMNSEEILDVQALPESDPAMDAQPGDDIPVAPWDQLSVITYVQQCMDESKDARRQRDEHNKINYDTVHCRQDTSDKVPGQSTEFLPKTAMALEQFGAFIKRGMVAFGNYFDVRLTPSPMVTGDPLTESGITKLMRRRLEDRDEVPTGCLPFPTLISDAVKVGGLGALCIAKVGGYFCPTRRLSVNLVPMVQSFQDPLTGQPMQGVSHREELVMSEGKVWRLCVELIRPEDYFPDPTGRGLYEIHRTYKDLHEVVALAESGEYDPEAVEELAESCVDVMVESDLERETDQPTPQPVNFRKQIELWEFWGTVLDSDGNVAHRNVYCTIANRRYLIRKPEPNPYWHQESPFVVAPLLRVPFSVFHKALFDYAVRLNLAMNEVFNLIVDGGIGSVWGVRQIHEHLIKNIDDFSNGIPQGATLIASEEAQQGVPVFVQTPAGVVPPEAMGTFQLLDREFAAASMLSDTARGMTPRKEVSATAVASADQSTSAFFDSIISDLEQSFIKPILRLVWLTMLQNCDDWNAEDVVGCIGPSAAQALGSMSPARRYATYAQGARFQVSGLSSMVARTREFQKIMAVMSALSQSPMLAQVAMTESSPKKLYYHLLKCLNLDPEDLRMTEEEQISLEQRLAQYQMFAGMAGGAQGDFQAQMDPSQMPGNPTQQVQAEIAQMNQPPQGL